MNPDPESDDRIRTARDGRADAIGLWLTHTRTILAIAQTEIRRFRRSRTTLLFTLFFLFSAWRVPNSVSPIPGDSGSSGTLYTYLRQPETYDAVYAVFGYTSTSFHVNSLLVLVPIFGLTLGYGSIAKLRASGQLRTLLVLPASRRTVILGTFFGRGLVLTAVLGTALTVGWIVIITRFETAGIVSYLAFSLATLAYGLVWLSVGIALSSAFSTPRRVAAAVFLVFVGVMFNWHGIILIDVLGLFPEGYALDPQQAYLILASAPYEELIPSIHTSSLEGVDGFASGVIGTRVFTAASDVPIYLTWPVSAFVFALWIAASLSFAHRRLQRTELT